jgi:hypothetical protein
MKLVHQKDSPFTLRPYYDLNEIENLCASELRKVNLFPDQPEPIRIDSFIEKRFGFPEDYQDLPHGVLGFTRFGANGVSQIVISSALDFGSDAVSERRVRTTMAHEAGHGLLHSFLYLNSGQTSLFDLDSDPSKVLCREQHIEEGTVSIKYDGRWWEYQANCAMGALLLPQQLVRESIDKYIQDYGSFGLKQIDPNKLSTAEREVAEIFNVNPIVAKIRLKVLFGNSKPTLVF